MVASELSTIRPLVATVRAARAFSRSRDNETGAHVDRTAYYSRLIVRAIAPQYALDDEQIERVFLFSPLHDIGKIGIPDNVLLKPGRLSGSEYAVMKTGTVQIRVPLRYCHSPLPISQRLQLIAVFRLA